MTVEPLYVINHHPMYAANLSSQDQLSEEREFKS